MRALRPLRSGPSYEELDEEHVNDGVSSSGAEQRQRRKRDHDWVPQDGGDDRRTGRAFRDGGDAPARHGIRRGWRSAGPFVDDARGSLMSAADNGHALSAVRAASQLGGSELPSPAHGPDRRGGSDGRRSACADAAAGNVGQPINLDDSDVEEAKTERSALRSLRACSPPALGTQLGYASSRARARQAGPARPSAHVEDLDAPTLPVRKRSRQDDELLVGLPPLPHGSVPVPVPHRRTVTGRHTETGSHTQSARSAHEAATARAASVGLARANLPNGTLPEAAIFTQRLDVSRHVALASERAALAHARALSGDELTTGACGAGLITAETVKADLGVPSSAAPELRSLYRTSAAAPPEEPRAAASPTDASPTDASPIDASPIDASAAPQPKPQPQPQPQPQPPEQPFQPILIKALDVLRSASAALSSPHARPAPADALTKDAIGSHRAIVSHRAAHFMRGACACAQAAGRPVGSACNRLFVRMGAVAEFALHGHRDGHADGDADDDGDADAAALNDECVASTWRVERTSPSPSPTRGGARPARTRACPQRPAQAHDVGVNDADDAMASDAVGVREISADVDEPPTDHATAAEISADVDEPPTDHATAAEISADVDEPPTDHATAARAKAPARALLAADEGVGVGSGAPAAARRRARARAAAAASATAADGGGGGAAGSADALVLVYPLAPGAQRQVVLRGADVARLQSHAFLNDTIVDFALRYAECEGAPARAAARVYAFSSFWLSKARETTRAAARLRAQQAAAARAATGGAGARAGAPAGGVRVGSVEVSALAATNAWALAAARGRFERWTRHVDIFEKDLLLVPVHDKANMHWALGVVAYARETPFLHAPRGTPIDVDRLSSAYDGGGVNDGGGAGGGGGAGVSGAGARNAGVGGGPHAGPDAGPDAGPARGCAACILYLDSLGGMQRWVFKEIVAQLHAEWVRRGHSHTIGSMDGAQAPPPFNELPFVQYRIPKQTNAIDCGLFLIESAERLMRAPPSRDDILNVLRVARRRAREAPCDDGGGGGRGGSGGGERQSHALADALAGESGDVSGDVSGEVSGDVSGNASGNGTRSGAHERPRADADADADAEPGFTQGARRRARREAREAAQAVEASRVIDGAARARATHPDAPNARAHGPIVEVDLDAVETPRDVGIGGDGEGAGGARAPSARARAADAGAGDGAGAPPAGARARAAGSERALARVHIDLDAEASADEAAAAPAAQQRAARPALRARDDAVRAFGGASTCAAAAAAAAAERRAACAGGAVGGAAGGAVGGAASGAEPACAPLVPKAPAYSPSLSPPRERRRSRAPARIAIDLANDAHGDAELSPGARAAIAAVAASEAAQPSARARVREAHRLEWNASTTRVSSARRSGRLALDRAVTVTVTETEQYRGGCRPPLGQRSGLQFDATQWFSAERVEAEKRTTLQATIAMLREQHACMDAGCARLARLAGLHRTAQPLARWGDEGAGGEGVGVPAVARVANAAAIDDDRLAVAVDVDVDAHDVVDDAAAAAAAAADDAAAAADDDDDAWGSEEVVVSRPRAGDDDDDAWGSEEVVVSRPRAGDDGVIKATQPSPRRDAESSQADEALPDEPHSPDAPRGPDATLPGEPHGPESSRGPDATLPGEPRRPGAPRGPNLEPMTMGAEDVDA
ncbi:hypothetical protein KFE25_002637 [Diacronema lutheri]|uniref:Ubiquitin-like protease family profile domain-containing protein n=1 Tax=Diacronema lutheri TaxID=2081491 RepID=A0A8J5XMX6_DIALT|nr:hypothetical protein KFE25_002637 [Diacronema lutheri]